MKKRYAALAMLICVTVISLCGCFLSSDKEFSKAGMTITLTSKFVEKELVTQTAYYESTTSIVTVLKEPFSTVAGFGDYTLEEYTNAVLKANKLNSQITKYDDKDYYSFSYEKDVNGKDFYYFATTFKASDAFWLIQFACTTSNKDKFQDNFIKWADSVTFAE
ncbi:MAG: hypothetical protein K2M64_00430 [Clostridia bacterium]|nr:hypothetical protein [Clostridia bacterium]